MSIDEAGDDGMSRFRNDEDISAGRWWTSRDSSDEPILYDDVAEINGISASEDAHV